MKLKRIEVRELFGDYNYKIELNMEEMITILHAPNGYGKTTILRLIKAIIEGDMQLIDEIPFKQIELIFDNSDKIKICKEDTFFSLSEMDLRELRNKFVHSDKDMKLPFYYEIDLADGNSLKFNVNLNYDVIMRMIRLYGTRYNNKKFANNELCMTFGQALKRFELSDEAFETEDLYNSLINYKDFIHIHIIESNRLFKVNMEDSYYTKDRINTIESINIYSDELKGEIVKVREIFGNKSEQLDRSFPNRLLDLIISGREENILSEDKIRKKLIELETKRISLEELGLVNSGTTTKLPEKLNISLDTSRFLTLYIEDNEKKLEVFDEIKNKIDLLLEIINIKNGFSNKRMKIDRDNGVVFELNNGKDIKLEKLSSGEKNDFILFYELLFKCDKKSIVFIDEPEISLHIAWQQEFVKELLKICNMNKMQALIATHSPNIVDEYWDLMVDLEEV